MGGTLKTGDCREFNKETGKHPKLSPRGLEGAKEGSCQQMLVKGCDFKGRHAAWPTDGLTQRENKCRYVSFLLSSYLLLCFHWPCQLEDRGKEWSRAEWWRVESKQVSKTDAFLIEIHFIILLILHCMHICEHQLRSRCSTSWKGWYRKKKEKNSLKIVHVLKEFTGYSKYTNNRRQSMTCIREVQGGVMEIQSKERMIEAIRNGFVEALHLNLVL